MNNYLPPVRPDMRYMTGYVPCVGCVNPSECAPHQSCERAAMHPEAGKTGWVCPKCDGANAPFMPVCGHCRPVQQATA